MTQRSTHPRVPEPRQTIDLADDGVLYMINVQVFHPLGFALCYNPTEKTFALFGDGSQRWVFSEDGPEKADNDRKWAAFHALLDRARAGTVPAPDTSWVKTTGIKDVDRDG